jgi:hypothetical protein
LLSSRLPARELSQHARWGGVGGDRGCDGEVTKVRVWVLELALIVTLRVLR